MKRYKIVRCIQNNKNSSSLIITIPSEWCKLINLTKNDCLKFEYDDKSAIVTKIEVD